MWWFLIVLFGCLPMSVDAHGIRIMASLLEQRIEGYVYYPNAGRAAHAPVVLSVQDGEELAKVQTAEDGTFQFAAPPAAYYRLQADTGDGHLARFRLAGTLAPKPAVSEPASHPDSNAEQIETIVARQLLPIKEQLQALQDQRRWTDILGAIGYIFGLAGVAFYWLGRKESDR
jgi:nickel transport protein